MSHTTAMSRVTAGNLGRGWYTGCAPLLSYSASNRSSAAYSSVRLREMSGYRRENWL